MRISKTWRERLGRHFGAGLAAVFGVVMLISFTIGGGLTHLSYDIPFKLRQTISAKEAVIIYLDDDSHRDLQQPYNAPWNRALHAQLVEKLKATGARAVVFDIIFDEPHTNNPAADEMFARAIKENSRVVLAADCVINEPPPGVKKEIRPEITVPYEPFAKAAAGWGHAKLSLDPGFVVRQLPFNYWDASKQGFAPSLPWSAAKVVDSAAINKPGSENAKRWINYYGPPGHITNYSYSLNFDRDIELEKLEEFYKDKVVFIGARQTVDFSGKGKDEFDTPYSRWGMGSSPGVEVHTTAFLNLLRGDWLTRVPLPLELALVVLFGAASGVAMMRLIGRRVVSEGLALGVMLAVAVLAHLLVWRFHIWFAWLILPLQVLITYLYALAYHTLVLLFEKKLLARSLTLHLSPARVEQLLKEPELLKPGGRQQEVSVLFTDIEDFSKLAQRKTPEDLFRMLNGYYAAALKGVHQTDGTVVQLIGDAIFAVWNAPLPHPDHRERACRAAVELHAHLADFEPQQAGRPQFVTRVGVHTGTAVVGNLGSQDRFEFTAIGETVNLASRLEGLNKHLGTHVLATRAIQSAVENEMTCRGVGLFQFKGFGNAVEVYELLVKPHTAETTRPWRAVFDEAVQLFQAGKFTAAEAKFREVIQIRRRAAQAAAPAGEEPPADGPSEFYLERIAEFRLQPPPENWHGEIVMKEK